MKVMNKNKNVEGECTGLYYTCIYKPHVCLVAGGRTSLTFSNYHDFLITFHVIKDDIMPAHA